VNATIKHGFHHSTEGVGGRTVTCMCGFVTALHRTAAAAADEWRAHAGLPPVRYDLHPAWCDELHEQEPCEVHVSSVGVVAVSDDVFVTALLDDSGPDRGLVVTVSVLVAGVEVEHRIALDMPAAGGAR
jgi:hypothetical protein